jgi:hypothetical protein
MGVASRVSRKNRHGSRNDNGDVLQEGSAQVVERCEEGVEHRCPRPVATGHDHPPEGRALLQQDQRLAGELGGLHVSAAWAAPIRRSDRDELVAVERVTASSRSWTGRLAIPSRAHSPPSQDQQYQDWIRRANDVWLGDAHLSSRSRATRGDRAVGESNRRGNCGARLSQSVKDCFFEELTDCHEPTRPRPASLERHASPREEASENPERSPRTWRLVRGTLAGSR